MYTAGTQLGPVVQKTSRMYLKKGPKMKFGPFLLKKGGQGLVRSVSGAFLALTIHQAHAVIVRYLLSPRAQHNDP